MHDLVIKGGRIVDGTGAASRAGDVAIRDGVIVHVGEVTGPAAETLDATGCLVCPGWVDIHTHYDGQASWDQALEPSSSHGVTTAVMGNCGVGFAPVRPGKSDWLVSLMERVEDIPGSVLAEGVRWDWETFPQYLDSLEALPRAIDIAAQVPHAPVRAYVLGEEGAHAAVPSADAVRAMADIVREGLEAGALGFSTSRTLLHRSAPGQPMPGTFAPDEELLAIAEAIAAAGHGVIEMSSDMPDLEKEFALIGELSRRSGAAVTYALVQNGENPERWRRQLRLTETARHAGAMVTAQIACRATGMVLGLQSSLHPLLGRPSYWRFARLPLADRLAALRRPEVRAQILSEANIQLGDSTRQLVLDGYDRMFPLMTGAALNYEPDRSQSIAAMAASCGRRPDEVLYDLLLEGDGAGFVYLPLLNYTNFNLNHVFEMMQHPATVPGLSDGGAHCGFLCDAGFPTFLLTHWVRDRTCGPRLPLERAVQLQTQTTAALYGLRDRGAIAAGMKADINIIDFDRLRLLAPEMRSDLPAGGARLLQGAEGYRATIVSGIVTRLGDKPTGRTPGRLVRGPRRPAVVH